MRRSSPRGESGGRPLARLSAVVLAIAVIVGAVVLLGRTSGGRRPLVPSGWQRGMNFTSYTAAGFATQQARAALRALRATGTGHVSFVPTWYMASATASAVAPDPAKTASDASVLAGMRDARALGLSVTLKPHVDVADGSFRGLLRPADPVAWFASYRAMIDNYATMAADGGAQTLVVGDELKSQSGRTSDWRALIDEVRRRFAGKLTYGANWVDEAEQVDFWDALDAIGVDGYMPLSRAGTLAPSQAALRSAWSPYVRRLGRLHRRWNRPVWFTELGYASVAGTAASPQGGAAGRIDPRAQADAYQAAFAVWAPITWCEGVSWWDWSADGLNAATADGSLRPAGKLAENVLRVWYGTSPNPTIRP